MSDESMDAALGEFIAESQEIIERVSAGINQLSGKNGSESEISDIYRDVHTLKGTSQLFGFQTISRLSHTLEACLDPVRNGKLILTQDMTASLSTCIAQIDQILCSIEADGSEGSSVNTAEKAICHLIDTVTSGYLHTEKYIVEEDIQKIRDKMNDAKNSEVTPETESVPASDQSMTIDKNINDNKSNQQLVQNEINTSSHTVNIESSIRVNVSLLDKILNLVGELVLVKNQVAQFNREFEDTDYSNISKNLEVITSDLQGEIMKTRMQPIDTILSKFKRVVRDISHDLNKKIDLTLEGADTELDKSLLEAIKDPLTHIIRNACDHGIEGPQERKDNNKPETGHLLIRSYHEGGQVVVEVSDDGHGINKKNVLKKALEKGLISQAAASKLSDRDICELVLRPGFSTAASVTSVSGRGVGMDVVKTNIEKIGGSVEIKSKEGKGTTIQMRIPLTLAIVPALIVQSDSINYAIPQVKLEELVRVDDEDANSHKIEYLESRPVLRLRGQLLPLCNLRDVTSPKKKENKNTIKSKQFIVVLATEGEKYGLIVDDVLDTADIVVKPLSGILSHVYAFSGATIMGDGSVALILDVGGIAENTKVVNKKLESKEADSYSKKESNKKYTEIQEFLIFSVGTDTDHSIPLCLVSRLEEIHSKDIEITGKQKVVQYRGGILPIIDLHPLFRYDRNDEQNGFQDDKKYTAIVVQKSGKRYGLLVDEIKDVVSIDTNIDDSVADTSIIIGNILTQNKVIVVIDALGIIDNFNSDILGQSKKTISGRNALDEIKNVSKEINYKAIRVLYAEDVAFFRRHVTKVLSAQGIDVVAVEDGKLAYENLLECEKDRYNLVISDIEMPNLDGLGLAKKIRSHSDFNHLPMIALTTRFRDKDREDGKEAGFDAYLEKLNPDTLIEAINTLMKNHIKDQPLGA